MRINGRVGHAASPHKIVHRACRNLECRRANNLAGADPASQSARFIHCPLGQGKAVPGGIAASGPDRDRSQWIRSRMGFPVPLARQPWTRTKREAVGEPRCGFGRAVIDDDVRVAWMRGGANRFGPRSLCRVSQARVTPGHSGPQAQRIARFAANANEMSGKSCEHFRIQLARRSDLLHVCQELGRKHRFLKFEHREAFGKWPDGVCLEQFASGEEILGHSCEHRLLSTAPIVCYRSAELSLERLQLGGHLPVMFDRVEAYLPVRRALQITKQTVVIRLRNRIELVVVTTSTCDRESEKGLAEDIDHVVEPIALILPDVDRRMNPFAEKPKARSQNRFVAARHGMTSRWV